MAAALRTGLMLGACLAAATAAAATPARAQQGSPFRPERFDEDWPDQPGEDAPFGAYFKNLHLNEETTISFGGDLRWRFASLDAPRLGIGGEERDNYMLQRLLLHADLRMGDEARIFMQLGAHDGVDRERPSPSDDDGLEMQQAFVDFYLPVANGKLTARIGRQELALGPRFVTTRDGSNARQRHDLVRLTYANDNGLRFDVFGGRPTIIDRGAFDDGPDLTQEFVGARLQQRFGANTLDLYAYLLDRSNATLAGATADDARQSYGVRWAGRSGAWDYDAELVAQAGTFGSADIQAYAAALDFGRTFDAAWKPRLGARVSYGSGDRDLSDDEQNAFSPPFPDQRWFGQNGLGTFTNIAEAALTLNFEPAEKVEINLKAGGVWRAEESDFIYSAGEAISGSSGGGDRFVGAAAQAMLIWRPNPNVTISPYVSFLDAGEHPRSLGGDDVFYAHLMIGVRF